MRWISSASGLAFVLAIGQALGAWRDYSVASSLISAAIFGVAAVTTYWIAERKVPA